MILGSDTVTRLRGRSRDNFGNLQGSDSELDIGGCSVQPLGGAEQTDRGESVQSNLAVYMPDGSDVVATDRVRWQGSVYAVNGPPAVWAGSHVEAFLMLKEGNA